MFKNILHPKERMTSKNYAAPTKGEATTGRYSPAGDYHGVGHKNPIGKEKAISKYAIPLETRCANPNELDII